MGLVGRTGDVVNVADVSHDTRYNPAIDRLTGHKTKSMLCVPVTVYNAGGKFLEEGRIVAVIEALNKKAHSPNDPTETNAVTATSSPDATVPPSSTSPPPTSPQSQSQHHFSSFSEEDVSLLKFIALLAGTTD